MPVVGVIITMQLTENEQKLVDRMQRQERSWVRGKWFAILTAVTTFAGFLLGFLWLHSQVKNDAPAAVAVVAFLSPILWLFCVTGSYWLARAIRDWRGNPERTLLLKLINEAMRNEGGDSQQDNAANG